MLALASILTCITNILHIISYFNKCNLFKQNKNSMFQRMYWHVKGPCLAQWWKKKSFASLWSKCQFCGNIYYLSFERPSNRGNNVVLYLQSSEKGRKDRYLCTWQFFEVSIIFKDTLHSIFFSITDKIHNVQLCGKTQSLHDWYFLAPNPYKCLRELHLNSY